MKRVLTLNGTWELSWSSSSEMPKQGTWYDANVPGDVTTDLSKQGILPQDIYYRDNLKQAKWIEDVYLWYKKTVVLDDAQLSLYAELVCDGIDMISDVFVNSISAGKTENAFMQYRMDVNQLLHSGENTIVVCIKPTRSYIKEMYERFPEYWALFTPGRNLVRHAQCQFGWDWSPDALSLGIWRDISIEFHNGDIIRDVFVETSNNGECVVRTELFFKQTVLQKIEKGVPHASFPVYYPAGQLLIDILFEGVVVAHAERTIDGVNTFTALCIDDVQLWWPNGLGTQHIYTVNVALVDSEGAIQDRHSIPFGFRSVEIVEPVIEIDRTGFTFVINGEKIFAKGANWVPLDCFPGLVTRERYEKILKKAQEAHINMLRIWGGGIYEHQWFYELCDRYGIMVWQDFMNACADIPDDNQELLNTLVLEAEYQIKRLRNHPAIVCWCGGNESSSSHMYEPGRPGRKIVNYYYRGIVGALTHNTLYIPGSSHGKSDFGQTHTSGETHWSMWPRTKETTYGSFRERLQNVRTVFNGEVSLQGPSPLKSLHKVLDAGDMWPPTDMYDFHAMNHPAMPEVHPRWVTSQIKATEQIIGTCDSIESFTANGMMMHAQMVEEELLYYRSQRPRNSGALIWMFNEPWPCMNWAVIDYYGNTKAAYWAMKRSFSPVACYIRKENTKTILSVLSDSSINAPIEILLTGMVFPDDIIWEKCITIRVEDSNSYCKNIVLEEDIPQSLHAMVFCSVASGDFKNTYSYLQDLPKDIEWPKPDFSWTVNSSFITVEGKHCKEIIITAHSFCRALYIDVPDISDYDYSVNDAYFDMLPHTVRTIYLESSKPIHIMNVQSLITMESPYAR